MSRIDLPLPTLHQATRVRRSGVLFWLCLLTCGCHSEREPIAPLPSREGQLAANAVVKGDASQDPLVQLDWSSLDDALARSLREAVQAAQSKPQSADAWGHLGMLLLAHDLFEPATACFAKAAALDPTQPRWPYFQGIALRTLDPPAAATQLAVAVKQFSPHVTAPKIRLANLLMELNHLDAAEKLFKEVLAVDRNNIEAATACGQIHLQRNQPRECLESIRPILSRKPPTRRSLLLAAESYRRLGALEVAERQQALAARAADVGWVDPVYAPVLALRTGLKTRLVRADELFIQNRVDESVHLLKQVVLEYPDSEWARILLARGQIRQRRLDDAQKTLNSALAINPNSFEAHFRMAVALQVKEDYEQAGTWFAKTVKLQPTCAVAYKNLAFCRSQMGDQPNAEAYLKQAIAVQPNYFDAYLALAEHYSKQGDQNAARAAIAQAERVKANDPRIQQLKSRLLKAVNE